MAEPTDEKKSGESAAGVQDQAAEQREKAQAEYDQAWDDEPKSQEGKDQEGVSPKTDDKDNKKPPEGAEKTEQSDSQVSKTYGTVESMEKALNDTKSHAGKLQAEVAELRKKLEQYERGEATHKDVKDQAAAADKARLDLDKVKSAVYEDYPELQPLVDALIAKVQTAETEVETLKKERATDKELGDRKEALKTFEREVKPKVVEKHKDFDEIVKSEEYWKWAETQSPALRFAAMDSGAPDDIIWAVGEYKKSVARGDVSSVKARESAKQEAKVAHLQTLRGGSTSMPKGKDRADQGDYDAGWDEADAALKKEKVL